MEELNEQEKALVKALGNSSAPKEGEKVVYGVYSLDDVKQMHDDFKATISINASLRKIGTDLFRQHYVRALTMLTEGNDIEKVALADELLSQFCAIQSMVLTKDTKCTEKIRHKAGDFRRTENGDPIPTADGKGYEVYRKDEVEYRDIEKEVPYYDYSNNAFAYNELKRYLYNLVVEPDFKKLEDELSQHIDYDRGLELIREITNYYKFDSPETFVERFALLICNAKAKGLNKHPKWPVMFSLVGNFGQGKGWFARKIKESYDRKFHTQSRQSSFKRLLDSNFNSIMMTRGFIHFDEKNGMDASQAEQLKSLITEPYVEVERKHLDTMTIPNHTTFISTTNESIKDVMGLQQDRRLVEFVLIGKSGEMPEELMDKVLDELWEVMPCEHPNPYAIISQLLDESKSILDAKMDEIVYDLFNFHDQEFISNHGTGRMVNRVRMKQVVKSNFSSTRFNSLFDWCVKEGILSMNKNGHVYFMRRQYGIFKERIEAALYLQDQKEG